MNLRYCLITAAIDCGETRHAQEVMRELGISYQHATPQSIGDQWWFWNCTGVTFPLPQFLTPLTVKPREAIGRGLSESDANRLESSQ
jgi:hypothetical protein